MKRTGALSLFAIALFACSSDGIEQRAYFKNDHGDRIKTFEITGKPSAADIERHARALVAPAGVLAAAYYFDAGATIPRDGVTLAKSVNEANHVLYEMPGISPWRYAYMASMSGSTEFVDCTAAPANALCRK